MAHQLISMVIWCANSILFFIVAFHYGYPVSKETKLVCPFWVLIKCWLSSTDLAGLVCTSHDVPFDEYFWCALLAYNCCKLSKVLVFHFGYTILLVIYMYFNVPLYKHLGGSIYYTSIYDRFDEIREKYPGVPFVLFYVLSVLYGYPSQ